MEQNGNDSKTQKPSPEPTTLSILANKRREHERLKAEAKLNGSKEPDFGAPAPHFASMPESKLPPPAEIESDRYLTSIEAAKILGFAEKSFRNMVSNGKIPHYKLFGQNRFKKDELLALLVKIGEKKELK